MRSFFRLLIRLNGVYDRIQEPFRILIFIGPVCVGGMATMGSIIFGDGFWIGVGPIFYIAIFAALGLFRLPVTMDQDWINTYKIGIPVPFANKISIRYEQETRDEIIKWSKENFRFYHGTLDPYGEAKFTFLKERDAAAFKLRWYE